MPTQDKVALVTGASRGIGLAIAKMLQEHGFSVAGTATTSAGAQRITDELAGHDHPGVGVVLNVNEQSSIDAALQKISETLGDITILVNNAGIARDNLVLRMKDDEWDSVISTNLTAVQRVTKACLKTMLKARWGRIITITSVVGCTGNPGQANYAAAKAGVIGFSKSLAQEIASRGITVNAIAPGFIDTDMTRSLNDGQRAAIMSRIPMGSLGQPDDIAALVSFLASEGARYITGETLHVNGGMYMA